MDRGDNSMKLIAALFITALFLVICFGIGRTEDIIHPSTDVFKGSRLTITLPREKPKFPDMVVECNLRIQACYWVCRNGFEFKPVLRGDQMVDEVVGCTQFVGSYPHSGFKYYQDNMPHYGEIIPN